MPIINECDCYRCGACISECPQNAIRMDERIIIDNSLCIECGECAEICPTGAIIVDH
ncbi:MAG: 4Fe-4S binding protein [Candidatus Methanomethylophilaceae archaeon]|nr:4Fe-4S binding protein [Candidatus Methanomethylophilaceae archaeon]